MKLTNEQQALKAQILDLSRQNRIGPLTEYLSEILDKAIVSGFYPNEDELVKINDEIIRITAAYREQTGVSTVVLGMSGGIDSALTAAIFKKAGWRVIGVTMPIHQVQAETDRGIEACDALGIEHVHMDLSSLYEATLATEDAIDEEINDPDALSKAVKIRRGNIRARLRMITLYNLAAKHGGIVGSTDNVTELLLSFFTLHGDVGDFAPIQSLTKSWEVPYLARLNGVPESTVRATPTDGLGIDAGDEAQLGASYLEMDIAFYAKVNDICPRDDRADHVFGVVSGRIASAWHKRFNPINVKHPLMDRFGMITHLDEEYIPSCIR